MTRNTFVWLLIIVAVTVVLGGASLIVANNPVQAAAGAPVGFIH
jgi:ABC-type sugar transport system permease subunit